jgi:hypothetical protein
MVCAMTVAAIGAWSHGAEAFALKHTSHGQPLRWAVSQVSYVVDPSVERAVPGGSVAVSNAVSGWSQAAGGPALSATAGAGRAKAGLDGQNSILLAPEGFAPAGGALAVTVTSYDEATGSIVDSDIVINGIHAFAVLAADARPDRGADAVSTDGASSEDGARRTPACDLAHVVSHEVGHTLGLADEHDSQSSLMYAFTMPGDASIRTPASDDVNGVAAIYGASGAPAAAALASRSGCGVAGSPGGPEEVWSALALIAAAAMSVAARHRAKGARLFVPLGAAFVVLVAWPEPARSAPLSVFAGDGVARIMGASTLNVGGVFETTLDLVPIACRHEPCPARAQANVWGGTLGGITQRIGGGDDAPGVGQVVDVAFLRAARGEMQLAAVLPLRH